MLSTRMGVSASPMAVPTRFARVTRPTAVARSSIANQLAGIFVQAFSRKGWATAIPIVLHSTRLKFSPARPRSRPKTAISTAPTLTARRNP